MYNKNTYELYNSNEELVGSSDWAHLEEIAYLYCLSKGCTGFEYGYVGDTLGKQTISLVGSRNFNSLENGFYYMGMAILFASGGGKIGSTVKPNPLDGVKYQQKVLDQMKIGDYHSFPREFDSLAVEGKITHGVDRNGRPETRIATRGSYDGKEGTFEWGINYKNELFHRLFRPD